MSFLKNQNARAADVKIANIDGDIISTNQEAVPVPFHTGYQPHAVKWFTKAFNVTVNDVQQQTGKKSTSTVARDYYADLAGVVCLGIVSYLERVYINESVVWSGVLERDPSGDGATWKEITITNWGLMRIYWGTETQDPDPWLTDSVPNPAFVEEYDEGTGTFTNNGEPEFLGGVGHPAYRGQCYVVFKQLFFGRNTTSAPSVVLAVGRLGDCPLFSHPETVHGVSPLVPAYELLTNKRFGYGLDPSVVIHSASWIATAAAIQPGEPAFENRQISNVACLLTKPTAVKEIFAELASYYDGWFRVNNGKVEAGFFPHAAPASEVGLLVIDPQDMIDKRDPAIDFLGWTDTYNQFNVVHRDRYREFKSGSQPYQSLYNFIITSNQRPVTLQKPWCVTADNAKLLAADYGKIEAMPYCRGTLYCRSERVSTLLPGDVFRLTYSPLSINFLCRCTGTTIPDPDGGMTEVNFVQERGVMPQSFEEVTDDPPDPPTLDSSPVGMARAFELTKDFTDSELTHVAIIVARPHQSSLGYICSYALTDPDYEEISNHTFFAQAGRLDTAYSSVATGLVRITLGGSDKTAPVSRSEVERDDDTLLLFMNGEMFSVGEVTPLGSDQYELEVLRSRFLTPAESHALNSQVFLIERAKLDVRTNKNFLSNDTGLFKIVSYTATDTTPDADGFVVSLLFRDRSLDKPVIAWDTAVATTGSIGIPMLFSGTITDANNDLVQYAVVAQLMSGSTVVKEIVGVATAVNPNGSQDFQAEFTFWETGTWRIICRAMDSRDSIDGYAEKYYPDNTTPTGMVITGTAYGTVVTQLNGKNKTYYQTTAPSSGMLEGDVWFDTDDNYKIYRYTSSAWTTSFAPMLTLDGTNNITGLIKADGTTRDWVMVATKFQIWDGASATVPFEIVSGVVYIKEAMIQSVQAGKITAGTISATVSLTAATLDVGSGIDRLYADGTMLRYGDASGANAVLDAFTETQAGFRLANGATTKMSFYYDSFTDQVVLNLISASNLISMGTFSITNGIIQFGGSTNIYSGGTDILKTDDEFRALALDINSGMLGVNTSASGSAVVIKGVNALVRDSGNNNQARIDNTNGYYSVNNGSGTLQQVVGKRVGGWSTVPSDGTRAALTSGSSQAAHNDALRALITDLYTGHGLIGT